MDKPRPPTFQSQSDTAFRVNGWLVDVTLIEHWSLQQGGAKFHGLRTVLSILKDFLRTLQQSDPQALSAEQTNRVLKALWRLSEFGYYVPPEVFDQA